MRSGEHEILLHMREERKRSRCVEFVRYDSTGAQAFFVLVAICGGLLLLYVSIGKNPGRRVLHHRIHQKLTVSLQEVSSKEDEPRGAADVAVPEGDSAAKVEEDEPRGAADVAVAEGNSAAKVESQKVHQKEKVLKKRSTKVPKSDSEEEEDRKAPKVDDQESKSKTKKKRSSKKDAKPEVSQATHNGTKEKYQHGSQLKAPEDGAKKKAHKSKVTKVSHDEESWHGDSNEVEAVTAKDAAASLGPAEHVESGSGEKRVTSEPTEPAPDVVTEDADSGVPVVSSRAADKASHVASELSGDADKASHVASDLSGDADRASYVESELSLPGTEISGRERIQAFRERLSCFSDHGKWVFNDTPRALPWCVPGEEIWQVCDWEYRDLANGVFGAEADDIALGLKPGEWKVRPTLKYEWQVDESRGCNWRRFDRQGFCRTVGHGRSILIVGDSLSWQFHTSLLSNMNTDIRNPIFGPEKQSEFCAGHRHMCADVLGDDGGFSVIHRRNIFLTLGPFNRSEGDKYQQDWVRTIAEEDIKIVILNRGAWPVDDARYERDLEATLVGLRERYPDLLIIFRNTPPGHKDCGALPDEPLLERQPPDNLPFQWGTFRHQNSMAKAIVEKVGGVYMDVDTMTALRPDGHRRVPGWRDTDCLHYCMPGPIDLWVQLFYNILVQALVPPLSL